MSGPDVTLQTKNPRDRTSDASPSDVLTPLGHMLAGAVAGTAEHIAMFPVDTVKTRMQALGHPGQQLHRSTVRRALKGVLRREGIRGLYGGVGAAALGAGPSHALYFASYEAAKDALGGNRPGHQPLAVGCAGIIATVISDACSTPFDVVKQRLQVVHSPYRSVADCVVRMFREGGLRAFFKSYRTTLVMNAPFQAIYFATYESGKKAMGVHGEEEERLAVQLIAGGLAGGAAAGLTNPLDVIKTRLQLEGVSTPARYMTSAVIPTLRQIVKEEGARALWAGVRPRVLFHVPAAAICWGTYETVKRALKAV